jgi:hypothetical protein
MNSAHPTRRRSTVLLVPAILTACSSLITYGESGRGVVLFMVRDQALQSAILGMVSAACWYAWWRGKGPKSVKPLVASLLISSTLVAPFMVLQWVNRRTLHEDFPFVLFAFMSVHSLFIVLLLTPAVRRLRGEGGLRALKPGHWAGLLLGAVLAFAYARVLVDQLPCFLGVPNCD